MPATPAPSPAKAPGRLRIKPPIDVPEGETEIHGTEQMRDGSWFRLRQNAYVQTDRFLLKADAIDYNDETGDIDARGNVYLQSFASGEELWCDRAVYNLNDEVGKFYTVRGQSPMHVEARPRVLTSSNPFYFEGKWAEKLKEKYILHDGFITNCKMPKPWWVVRSPSFDIIPDDRAISHRAKFTLRRVPLFWTPYYYKSLEKVPRQSGFLMPNIGNSSSRGQMIGLGYYWAINRSYDATYRAQYFTTRGLAHTVDFRGKPNDTTDFGGYVYGIQDRGYKSGENLIKQGGYVISVQGKSDLGRGFVARGDFNYLSSFAFRQAFTESYNEAISSEVHSIGVISKDWSYYGVDFVGQRLENFQRINNSDTPVIIRKLPEIEFTGRDQKIWKKLPLWISWEMSGGMLRRKEIEFQTRNFLERVDVYPHLTTVLRWKDFAIIPTLSVRETHYGESRDNFNIIGKNIDRAGREANVQIALPSFARVFKGPKWLGSEVKHVIEPGANYKYVTGIDNFNQIIRFDETELYSNTNQIEYSLVNRLYVKRDNSVFEVLSWDLRQQRYFDQTFGGAITQNRVAVKSASGGTTSYVTQGWCGQVAGCRNVVLSALELTPYAFLAGPRNYSPIVSTLRTGPISGFGAEWRADYDPLYSKLVASSFSVDGRKGMFFLSAGHNSMRYPISDLSPNANEFRGQVMIGNDNRRGWSAGFMADYDYRVGVMRWITTQVTHNTDCCGFSIQYRRLNFGARFENQFRLAFAVANVGSFGTLKKQERMF